MIRSLQEAYKKIKIMLKITVLSLITRTIRRAMPVDENIYVLVIIYVCANK